MLPLDNTNPLHLSVLTCANPSFASIGNSTGIMPISPPPPTNTHTDTPTPWPTLYGPTPCGWCAPAARCC
jgi:hypothetical protein